MAERVALICPGRGSYTANELGWLQRPLGGTARQQLDGWLDHMDEIRTARNDLPVRTMDSSKRFSARFLRGENAASLIFACTLHGCLSIDEDKVQVVAVTGNSMGWYMALFAAGALDFENAYRLVDTMGSAQREGTVGGQVIYPITDENWVIDHDTVAIIEERLSEIVDAGHAAGWSIRLGGYAVLWGDDTAIGKLLDALPKQTIGGREYPFRLAGHAAFHSSLLEPVSQNAQQALADLAWQTPSFPLIDGQGAQFRPMTTDIKELRSYTLGAQVTQTYDFTKSVRVLLREYAPDRLVLLGPGETLFAPIAQVMIEEGWKGLRSKAEFMRHQKEDPFLVSLARPEQAKLVSHLGLET